MPVSAMGVLAQAALQAMREWVIVEVTREWRKGWERASERMEGKGRKERIWW